jgi:hypothetical protein
VKLPLLLAAALAAAAPTSTAFAQYPGSAARDACTRAVAAEARNRYPRARRIQTLDSQMRQQANAETVVSGQGQFDDARGNPTSFSFDCIYNSRSRQTYGVQINDAGYGGGQGGGYYPPSNGQDGYYPPGQGGYPPAQGGGFTPPPVGKVTTLKFANGASNNTVRGSVRAGRTTSYSVASRQGQVLNIGLRPDDRTAYFNVIDPRGRTIFDGSGGGNVYRGYMDGRGNYRIDVYLIPYGDRDRRGSASYYLDVELTN